MNNIFSYFIDGFCLTNLFEMMSKNLILIYLLKINQLLSINTKILI
jgi:hypothetical protein